MIKYLAEIISIWTRKGVSKSILSWHVYCVWDLRQHQVHGGNIRVHVCSVVTTLFFTPAIQMNGIVRTTHVSPKSMWFVHVTRHFCSLIGGEKWEHFPGPFQFLVFGSSVRAHTPWCTGVPARHWSLHTTGPNCMWAVCTSVRYVQIFLSASHIFYFIYIACSDM